MKSFKQECVKIKTTDPFFLLRGGGVNVQLTRKISINIFLIIWMIYFFYTFIFMYRKYLLWRSSKKKPNNNLLPHHCKRSFWILRLSILPIARCCCIWHISWTVSTWSLQYRFSSCRRPQLLSKNRRSESIGGLRSKCSVKHSGINDFG